MSREEREKILGVYLTIDTLNHEKKSTDLPSIMMGKWLEANIPGSLEAKLMRDGRILVSAENQETASKAIRNGNNFYDVCNLKTTRMDNMKTCQETVSGRALLTETLEDASLDA
jgi:hypothetical protein